jgi:hypothetical protein
MSASSSPPPPPPRMRMTASHKALAGLIGFLIAAKLIEMALRMPFRVPAQQAVFSWRLVIFYVALALLGSGFAHVVGFPGMSEKGVSNRGRIWTPLAIGVVLGAALLAVDHAIGFARLDAATFGVPTLSLPSGYNVFFQLFAAVDASILYYLFALSFTVWFFGTLLLSRRWPSQIFWIMAIFVSLLEPFAIASHGHWALLRLGPASAGVAAMLALIFAMDLAAAILFRRFGFTAAVALRVSAIAVWHIIGKL